MYNFCPFCIIQNFPYFITMKSLKPALFSIALFLAQFCFAQQKVKTKDSLNIAKALSIYNIGTPLLSPDGRKAIVAVTKPGTSSEPAVTHLWLVDMQAGNIRQFTSSQKSESGPKWSPDGGQISFLSSRSGMQQIYLMSMQGGEALPLTKSKTAISSYEWSPDGKTIAYITNDELTDSIKKRQADKFDERVMTSDDKPSRLYLINTDTKKTRQILKRNWDIDEIKWMPSGDQLMIIAADFPSLEIQVPKLIKYNINDSTSTILASPNHNFWGNMNISPDGKQIFFLSARTDGPQAHDLFVLDMAENKFRNISGKTLDRIPSHLKLTENNGGFAIVQQGFNSRLYHLTSDGTATADEMSDNLLSFDRAADGALIYVKTDFTHLPELYLKKPGAQSIKISDFNSGFAGMPVVDATIISYKSFDGKLIEGALYKPVNVSPGKLLPMVLYIHGGPTGAFANSYSSWAQILLSEGYAVFCPNIRGSTGYGWDFLISNRKDWGGADYKDMMAGVDYLVAHENIDANRLGISGWSYGGFMADWAVTQTRRFRAAFSGAGLSNLASEFGTESGVDYDHWFWGKPYENLKLYYKYSPIAYVRNARTPTLIVQGEDDTTDPIGQSQEFYRALRFYNVPAELVVYPREPHGFRELNHKVDYFNRMVAWFKKYI